MFSSWLTNRKRLRLLNWSILAVIVIILRFLLRFANWWILSFRILQGLNWLFHLDVVASDRFGTDILVRPSLTFLHFQLTVKTCNFVFGCRHRKFIVVNTDRFAETDWFKIVFLVIWLYWFLVTWWVGLVFLNFSWLCNSFIVVVANCLRVYCFLPFFARRLFSWMKIIIDLLFAFADVWVNDTLSSQIGLVLWLNLRWVLTHHKLHHKLHLLCHHFLHWDLFLLFYFLFLLHPY